MATSSRIRVGIVGVNPQRGFAFSPGFDAAARRHRLLGAIERASETGEKQEIRTA